MPYLYVRNPQVKNPVFLEKFVFHFPSRFMPSKWLFSKGFRYDLHHKRFF